MSLTSAEETILKKIAKKTGYENEIAEINRIANEARASKQAEIEAIETKRISDVKVKQDLIDKL